MRYAWEVELLPRAAMAEPGISQRKEDAKTASFGRIDTVRNALKLDQIVDLPVDPDKTKQREKITKLTMRAEHIYRVLAKAQPRVADLLFIIDSIDESGKAPEHFWYFVLKNVKASHDQLRELSYDEKGKLAVDRLPSSVVAKTLDRILLDSMNEYTLEMRAELTKVDDLTGLALRPMMRYELSKMIVETTGAVVFFSLDLDKFREANKKMGHDGGDQLLKEISARIQDLMGMYKTRYPDRKLIGSRWGGDEFAIGAELPVAEGRSAPSQQDVQELIKWIQEGVFDPPIRITLPDESTIDYVQRASIGSTIADNHNTLRQVVDRADGIMYEDKKRHKDEEAAAALLQSVAPPREPKLQL
jgi:diguanylate cyclase (GGDEF)-like protein